MKLRVKKSNNDVIRIVTLVLGNRRTIKPSSKVTNVVLANIESIGAYSTILNRCTELYLPSLMAANSLRNLFLKRHCQVPVCAAPSSLLDVDLHLHSITVAFSEKRTS